MKRLIYVIIIMNCLIFSQCAVVKPWERECLANPAMQIQATLEKQGLESKFFSTQEGSSGGNLEISGGCGCAK